MVVTPIVGKLYNRTSPRLLVALGLTCVAVGSLDMGRFTLETSQAGVIFTLLLQGVGFSCLFVPLTTVALSHVPRTKLADASGLNSLVRQFGGSAGLAIYGTLLDQQVTRSVAALRDHVNPYRPEVVERLTLMSRAFMSRGMDALTARSAALKAMSGMVAQQGTMIAFEHIFMLTGYMMLVLLPLTIFLRSKDHEDAARARAAGPAAEAPAPMVE
jgi:MFS transporter, DHA2 family, multidrug resistance protein